MIFLWGRFQLAKLTSRQPQAVSMSFPSITCAAGAMYKNIIRDWRRLSLLAYQLIDVKLSFAGSILKYKPNMHFINKEPNVK